MVWLYLLMMLVGGFALILSVLAGEITEASGGVLGAIDEMLEAIGIDIIPDAVHESLGLGPGCGYSIAMFVTFFGAVGLAATSYFHATALQSLVAAGSIGLLIAIATMFVVRMVLRQQASSETQAEDYIGAQARVSVAIPTDGIGTIIATIKGRTERFGASSHDRKAIMVGSIVEVVQKEGGMCIVKPV